MTERLLQFIWQFQYFNKSELETVAGEPVHVILPGRYNHDQGPDFSDAKINIAGTTWAGRVELHIRTSDWQRHQHGDDANYHNVILHVVWEHDAYANTIPVIELKSRVAKILLQRYEELMYSTSFIACEKSIHTVPAIIWKSWKERLLAERLLRKADAVKACLKQTNYHWEETFWRLLARNFGMKVNADAFEAVARSLPLTILSKQKNQIQQIEALLLGQAGLLERKWQEDYPKLLRREYQYQRRKHRIKPVPVPLHFLRMRPGNFPTVRLAQLAMLVHASAHLFSRIREAQDVKEIMQWFDVTANDYWHYHYRFDESSPFRKKRLGADMTRNIIINTIVPVLFAWGDYHNQQAAKDKALRWLEETAGEKNVITTGFSSIGIESKLAYDSQSLLELKTQYCDVKRCLDCAIGNALLKMN